MDVFKAYSLGTSAYLALQSLPLLITPRLIVTLLPSEPRRITDLETYLCRSQGLALLAFATLILLLTGLLPVSSTSEAEGSSTPYANPTTIVTTLYHFSSAAYLYTQLSSGWNFAFTCGIIASASLFCMGLWVLMFGGGRGHVSKRTGADKRTSNFPFSNAESRKRRKR
ncbi:hypothetical protein LTR37_000720 [Vermiconidia calcicola]|uniref:Uncharacterized protein n=1 Tax=Vermiconidia calcicola TaxID=1690605 RepID=A0ACC3NXS6_9PEZI|nr:hypothetical protein LTR37_000720 [Vermiconidia calcicola]